MDKLIDLKNLKQMYEFLLKEFDMVVLDETSDEGRFSDFYATLSNELFLIRYIYSRKFLTIEISSKTDMDNWYDLSFIKDFIYDSANINAHGDTQNNLDRIEQLNQFLREDFDKISKWFGKDEYLVNKTKLDKLLKESFERKFPGKIDRP